MENNHTKTKSLITLLCGIGPWVTMWIPVVNILNIPLAIAAIIMGIVSKNEGVNPMRIIGIILGSISLLLSILGILLIALMGDLFMDFL